MRLRALDIGDRDWGKVMNVNLKGVFNCSKAVMTSMMNQRSGKTVNMSPSGGLTGGSPSNAAGAYYGASKAGVICLTKVLARELAQYDINVSVMAPGSILTEILEQPCLELKEEM